MSACLRCWVGYRTGLLILGKRLTCLSTRATPSNYLTVRNPFIHSFIHPHLHHRSDLYSHTASSETSSSPSRHPFSFCCPSSLPLLLSTATYLGWASLQLPNLNSPQQAITITEATRSPCKRWIS